MGPDKKGSRWAEEREKSLNELVTVKLECERDLEKGYLWTDGEENRGHSRKDSEPCQTELFEEAGIVIFKLKCTGLQMLCWKPQHNFCFFLIKTLMSVKWYHNVVF